MQQLFLHFQVEEKLKAKPEETKVQIKHKHIYELLPKKTYKKYKDMTSQYTATNTLYNHQIYYICIRIVLGDTESQT